MAMIVRAVIYPKDVQRITGKSERAGRALLLKIKRYLKKKEHQVVRIKEFSQYMGLAEDQVTATSPDRYIPSETHTVFNLLPLRLVSLPTTRPTIGAIITKYRGALRTHSVFNVLFFNYWIFYYI